jgi:hypothetical protein
MSPEGVGLSMDLSCQEMLRTIGTLLDGANVGTATIALSKAGAAVAASTWPSVRTWKHDALAAETIRQRQWRRGGQGGPAPASAGRLSHDLRALGGALDADLAGPWVITLTPATIHVCGNRGETTVSR